MKVEPYISRKERVDKMWTEVANKLGVTKDEAYSLWFNTSYFGFLSEFRDSVNEGHITLEKLLKETNGVIPPHTRKKDPMLEELNQEMDRKNYELKSIVEIGDEYESTSTKEFTYSQREYLTKGKRYTITDLKGDKDLVDFTAVTTTNFPEERNWESNHGIRKLWRNGELIWSYWTPQQEKDMEEYEATLKR